MDLVMLNRRFVSARKMTFELLHRMEIAGKEYSQLCVEMAIREAQNRPVSTFEKIHLRTVHGSFKNWRYLALAQVDCLRQARNDLIMAKGGSADRRKQLDRRARG